MGKYEVITNTKTKIKRVLISITSILLITGGTILGIYYFLSLEHESKVIEEKLIEENKEEQEKDENSQAKAKTLKNFVVDIKGQIKKPGTYEVTENTRVIDVINKAGGLTKDADTSLINLSKKVFDEMVIVVHSKEDVQTKKTTELNDIENNASINNSENNLVGKININLATQEELQTLPGIGSSKAQDIINYRNENGKFTSIEEIINVSGIGESLFDKIKENITV